VLLTENDVNPGKEKQDEIRAGIVVSIGYLMARHKSFRWHKRRNVDSERLGWIAFEEGARGNHKPRRGTIGPGDRPLQGLSWLAICLM
jgi:hypothetical protein